MLPLTNHGSTQLDPFKYTEQPRLRAIVFLAEAVSLARMGMLPKTWEHPQPTACISTDLTPKPSFKVVLPSNRNSFSNRTWALACALAKICLKGKMAGGCSTCMFRSLFPDIGHKLGRIPLCVCCWLTQWKPHRQHSLHIILYLKTPELIQANKTNLPKKAPIGHIYRNLRDVKQLKPHVITCHHNHNLIQLNDSECFCNLGM